MAQLRTFRKSPPISIIAWITTRRSEAGWQAKLLNLVYTSACARAGQLGYRLERFYHDEPDMTGKRLSRILHTRNIQGAILAPLIRPRGHLALDWSLFAAVIIGYSLPRPRLHRVSKDDYSNMLITLRELRRLGYKRPGLALSRNIDHRVEFRYVAACLAWCRAMQLKGIPPLLPASLTPENVVCWYRKHRPEVIITTEDDLVPWLREHRIQVPEQAGVVHLERHPGDTVVGVDLNLHLIGSAAVEQLEAQLHQNELGIPSQPKLILVEGRWCHGQTVRRCRR